MLECISISYCCWCKLLCGEWKPSDPDIHFSHKTKRKDTLHISQSQTVICIGQPNRYRKLSDRMKWGRRHLTTIRFVKPFDLRCSLMCVCVCIVSVYVFFSCIDWTLELVNLKIFLCLSLELLLLLLLVVAMKCFLLGSFRFFAFTFALSRFISILSYSSQMIQTFSRKFKYLLDFYTMHTLSRAN